MVRSDSCASTNSGFRPLLDFQRGWYEFLYCMNASRSCGNAVLLVAGGRSVSKFRPRTLILIAAALGLTAFGGKRFYDWQKQVKSEYATAAVIREVTTFVESHHGEWPRSWDDIPGTEDDRPYVRMNFDVRAEELAADRDLIQTAIVPISGVYCTG